MRHEISIAVYSNLNIQFNGNYIASECMCQLNVVTA